jgi:hypothetical protein
MSGLIRRGRERRERRDAMREAFSASCPAWQAPRSYLRVRPHNSQWPDAGKRASLGARLLPDLPPRF